MPGYANSDYETAPFSLYRYAPSLTLAILATVFFILTTALHTYQLIRSRTWFYAPLVLGGYFEWIGYIGRVVNSRQTPFWTLGPYIQQSLLLLVAPALFAATIYMTLGRIVRLLHAEHHLFIRARRLTCTFVLGDVFCFLIQSSGAGLMAQGTVASMNTGSNIIVGGLCLQIVFFNLFVVLAVTFHTRMRKDMRRWSRTVECSWQRHMAALYTASGIILVRSIYRVVEYVQGNGGYILRHEWFTYVFDALLMFSVMVIFNVVHGKEINKSLGRGALHTPGQGEALESFEPANSTEHFSSVKNEHQR